MEVARRRCKALAGLKLSYLIGKMVNFEASPVRGGARTSLAGKGFAGTMKQFLKIQPWRAQKK